MMNVLQRQKMERISNEIADVNYNYITLNCDDVRLVLNVVTVALSVFYITVKAEVFALCSTLSLKWDSVSCR